MPQVTRWICFDVGEVLVDETRIWSTWADVLGIPRFTLMAAMGAAIVRGGDHSAAFAMLGVRDWQTFDDEVQRAYGGISAQDLYPDALPCLGALRGLGYRVAVIANQPERRHAELLALGVDPDVMAMSDALGVHKPDPRFFSAALKLMGAAPADVAYVGDRVDNDVVPAAAAGMRAVWLRRGPWAFVQSAPGSAELSVGSLEELVRRIGEVWGEGAGAPRY
jgi:HAD superfamily hydrolase (TIGR01549 family)